ncbi:hypothetical protein WMY93_003240 [Mugilogobius chulae]|uniref:Uncharacterized protein n=1 Tax=Mugilogobius chulae TaxID=88201 RepID=A0AAW0Q6Z9_9GOBI
MCKARKISTSQYQNCEEEPTGKIFLKKVKEERKDIESEKSGHLDIDDPYLSIDEDKPFISETSDPGLEDDYVKEPQSQHDEYRDDFESYDSLDEDGSFRSQTTEPNLKDDEVNSLSELSIEEDEDDFRRYASLEEDKPFKYTEDLKDDLQKKDDDFLIESEQKDLVSDQEIGAATLSKTYKLESDSDEEDSFEQFIAMCKARKISTSQSQNHEEEPTGKQFLKKVKEERKDIESEKSGHLDIDDPYLSIDEDKPSIIETSDPGLENNYVNSISEPYSQHEECEGDLDCYDSLDEDDPILKDHLESISEPFDKEYEEESHSFISDTDSDSISLSSNYGDKLVEDENSIKENEEVEYEDCSASIAPALSKLTNDTLSEQEEEVERLFKAENEEGLSALRQSLVEEIKAEEARLKKQHSEDLKKLRENLKADQQRQEIHFVQEHEAALKDISEEENRLKAANKERLENLRQSLLAERRRRKKGLRRNVSET